MIIYRSSCRISQCTVFVAALLILPRFIAEGFVAPMLSSESALLNSEPRHFDSTLVMLNSVASSQESSSEIQSRRDVQGYETLVDAIGFNASAATTLLSTLGMMREQGVPRETMESFLDELLLQGPDAPLPFWARARHLGRFSRRARMFSLRRTLDRTTPPANDNENGNESEDELVRRRRRTLISVLRSIGSEGGETAKSKEPLIVRVEKRAIQAEKDDASNLRNRLPEGLETPKYEIIASGVAGSKNIEIRRYEPYSVCAVSMTKPRPLSSGKTDATVQMPEMSGASSFGALAGYLFGKNQESTAMKMTTPVFTSPLAEGDRQMEFVLPSNYWDAVQLAPKPFSESGVTLQQIEPGCRAVVMFGGYASRKEVERRTQVLLAAVGKNEDWKAVNEEATVAQYNDPFTPAWKRLNEVSISVEPR